MPIQEFEGVFERKPPVMFTAPLRASVIASLRTWFAHADQGDDTSDFLENGCVHHLKSHPQLNQIQDKFGAKILAHLGCGVLTYVDAPLAKNPTASQALSIRAPMPRGIDAELPRQLLESRHWI